MPKHRGVRDIKHLSRYMLISMSIQVLRTSCGLGRSARNMLSGDGGHRRGMDFALESASPTSCSASLSIEAASMSPLARIKPSASTTK